MAMLEPSNRSTWRNADPAMLVLTLLLIGFGLVTLYSAGDRELGFSSIVVKQAIFTTIGLVAMGILAALDYRFWRVLILPVHLVALALLVLVLRFGALWGGAQRWFVLKIISCQPSEPANIPTAKKNNRIGTPNLCEVFPAIMLIISKIEPTKRKFSIVKFMVVLYDTFEP